MKAFLLGVVVTIICIAAGVYLFAAAGLAPVATSAPALPFEKYLARVALHARMEKEMPKTVPVEATEANYVEGAEEYVEHCAVCHGVPGKPPGPIVDGMFPKPPQLFRGKGVTDDSPAESYWKIWNGIRLSGMPSFNKHLTETEAWQIAQLLTNANKLPDSVKTILTENEPALPAGHTHAAGEGHNHTGAPEHH